MSATLIFKAEVMLAISRLPAIASARKVQHNSEPLAALRDSEKASAEGRVISHDEAVRRFRAGMKIPAGDLW